MDFQKEVIEKLCEGLPFERASLIQAIVMENVELRGNLEKVTRLQSKAAEDFEQERYAMKNKMVMMTNLEQHYTEEVAGLQEQLQTLKSSSFDSKLHEAELCKLRLKIDGLTSQLESAQASEKELEEKLASTEKLFAEYKEEQDSSSEQKSMMISEDYLQLQAQLSALQEHVEIVEEQLRDSTRQVTALLAERDALKSVSLARGEEVELMRAEIVSYTNALEKSREENLEFKVLLENLQLEKSEHGEKGNSLFGELDDRRIQAEKTLVNIQAQCELAKQQLTKEKQQRHRLSVQVTTMLQANDGNVSAERLQRMETLLTQLRSEKEELLTKLRQYETEQKEQMDKLLELQTQSGEGGEGQQDYTIFLSAMLQTKVEEMRKLKEEIHQLNFKLALKDEKVIDGNRKIYKLESELDKSHKKSLKQALTIEELKMKYEPEMGKAPAKQGKTEKIPMKPADDPNHDASAMFVLKESTMQHSSHTQNLTGQVEDCGDISKCSAPNDTTTETKLSESFLPHNKQVKIREQVEMISEEGQKESGAIRREEHINGKENFRSQKKPENCVVHHNVKKVSAGSATAADKSQCKQQ